MLVGAAIWIWLAGCGGGAEEVPPVPPVKRPPPPPQAEVPTPATAQSPAVATAAPPSEPEPLPPPLYAYRADNRRDPFRSVIVAGEKLAAEGLLHPLQKYAVRDLHLVAIVWGGFGASATLQTPDGKGYTVRTGMTVGNRDGVVKQIKPDHLVIEERYTDLFGERKEETIKMDLHPQQEGFK